MERAGRIITRVKLPPGTVLLEDVVCRGWTVAVGKRVAAHARATGFCGSRLVVEAEDAVWQGHLRLLERQILSRLDEVIGPGIVREIEFRAPVVRRMPQRASEPRSRSRRTEQAENASPAAVSALRKRGSST
jgi:predicted nucleic acid-binding Zn ribbon protein